MTEDALAAVLDAVRERVDPTPSERETLGGVAETVVERAEAAVADLPVDADVLLVGSAARGTWLSGDRDVDVFVRFPADLDRDDLERYGLDVGRAVLPDGRAQYAEHPYVAGVVDGVDVDLVPCYRVESAADIRSAVDRTPFHNAYLDERIDDATAAEVRLCKQFLVGVGAYGSDLRTRGFSGYLTELLVLAYGDFRATVEAMAEWHPPVELDPADHGDRSFDDPLVVVDPTDPERNVAAVVSAENVARVQHYARVLLSDPDPDVFVPDSPDPLDAAALRAHLARRDTTPVAVRFDPPDLVADELYPQLRRSLRGLVRGLEEHGFEVLRADAWAAESAVLFVELSVADLPAVERHEGPPVHVGDHARGFYEAYADADVYGPFLDGDRYVVEREREVRSAVAFVEDRLREVALGADVATTLDERGYAVLADDAVADLLPEFGVELARYVDPRP